MSDVLKTNELIVAKLRKAAKQAEWYQALDPKLLDAAADALEARLAALTTPQEGDARERLRKVVARGAFEDFSDYPLDGENALVERVIDALLAAFPVLSRATSPDDTNEATKQVEEDRAYLYQLSLKLGQERDAALAAIERIRQAVSGHPECDRYEEGDVISCGWKSAYASVVAALDGAPEPKVKP